MNDAVTLIKFDPCAISPALAKPLKVGLVNMPFGSTQYPSMQLGLLQAILAKQRHAATTHYFNLQFANTIGWELHEHFAWYAPRLVGEWLFSRAAFREEAPPASEYLRLYGKKLGPLEGFVDYLVQLREREAPAFIEKCLRMVRWQDYDVIGFGSVFEQNCAALALARRIKECFPAAAIVFGGANFEDQMGLEYIRVCPWIDYAVIGEGDEVFPDLLSRLGAASPEPDLTGLKGVAWRGKDGVCFAGRAAMVHDLDQLPTPDYGDFFAAATRLKRPPPKEGFSVEVPFESARGCWWGAKSQCTFCGLNGATIAFRSKTPGRVLAEIDELSSRYGVKMFGAVDNILDHRYVRDVFAPLAERKGGQYEFFYEVKANLTREQLRTMALGGVRRVQPGIESLSSHMLKLMRKGVTALQNVNFLKWAHFYGMEITWNILLGFPGERIEDYQRQIDIIPLLRHLPPAVAVTAIHLDRFSPYFDFADRLGIHNVSPDPAYASVYPPDFDLSRIAYYFEHEAPNTLAPEAHEPVYKCMHEWFLAWQSAPAPDLRYEWKDGDCLQIRDSRWGERARSYIFEGAAAAAYEFCGSADHSLSRICTHLRREGYSTDEASLRQHLAIFTSADLMLEEDGHFLSLALPVLEDLRKFG
jgi:ribosomal peptide maturation radical SAM protein 1